MSPPRKRRIPPYGSLPGDTTDFILIWSTGREGAWTYYVAKAGCRRYSKGWWPSFGAVDFAEHRFSLPPSSTNAEAADEEHRRNT
jgi:hypothetical protein